MVYSPIDDAARIVARAREDTPDELDSIVAETRDFTPEQARERLDQLGSYSRLSGRQRVEAALLSTHVQAADRAHAMYAAGTLGSVADGGGVGMPANRPPAGHGGWVTAASGDPRVDGWRAGAMRAVERHQRSGVLDSVAADRLDGVLRAGDRAGLTAAYIGAVADESYGSAFCKMLRDPVQGHLRFSREEVEAVRRAGQAQILNAGPLTTGSTGFPAPLEIDPSIIESGDGTLNPVRSVATVVTTGATEYQSVASAGVSAHYVAEGTEVSDDTPALTGPVIHPERGQCFVTFSAEAGQDDASLAAELGKLISDAKDVLDSSMFLSGSGSDEPSGLLNIGGVNGLTVSQRVQSAAVATFALGDPWSLGEAIPARFRAATTYLAAPSTLDVIYRFVGGGSTEPALMTTRDGPLMGKRALEWAPMDTGSATGAQLLVGGDFRSAFKIVDRIGMSVELVPHVMGANQRPLGVRGLYAFWRTGSGVVALNALRYLEVK